MSFELFVLFAILIVGDGVGIWYQHKINKLVHQELRDMAEDIAVLRRMT